MNIKNDTTHTLRTSQKTCLIAMIRDVILDNDTFKQIITTNLP